MIKLESQPSFDPLTLPEVLQRGNTFIMPKLLKRRDSLREDFSISTIKEGIRKTSKYKNSAKNNLSKEAQKREDTIASDAK